LCEFPAIICTICQYGVVRDHIDTHFTGKPHEAITKARRTELVDEIAHINGLVANEVELEQCEFPFPVPTAPPIPALGKPRTDGLQCTFEVENGECGYICCSPRHIRRHCLQKHGWQSHQKGGRPKRSKNTEVAMVPWRTNVHCQRFFIQGPKSGYFEVGRVVAASREPRMMSRADQFEAKKNELSEAIEKKEEEEDRKISEPDEAKEPSPWLRRVGWVSHLEGLDPKQLRKLMAPPRDEEPELQVLCKAFDWLIQDAQYHAAREVVGLEALFEANKKQFNQETQVPFDNWMDITTIQRYTEVCKQVLCFIFRAEQQEPKQRPPYELTEKQQMAVEYTQNSIEELLQWKEAQEPSSDEDENGIQDHDNEDESDTEIEFMATIQREILRLWITLLKHPLGDNEYKSVLISAMAVLGIREEGGWLDAEDYTPKYSAVIKMSRLMVIQEACKQRQEAIRWRQDRGYSLKEAERAVRSYYHLVRELVHAFMTMAHDGRDPTPMQWLYRSRTYGFKIRYTTTAQAKIQWIGDEILYPGMRFSMVQFRNMVHGLVHKAREVLFSKLMMVGMNCDEEVDTQQVPPISWDKLVDQPSESRVRWSFLEDERNQFAVDGK